MAIETQRHTEKAQLFALLRAKYTGDIDAEIARLMSIMEPEDVELVEKRSAELNQKQQGKKE